MTSPLTRRNLKLWIETVNLNRKVQADLRDRLRREFGWTLPKFQLMAMLANHREGITMSALASALFLSNPNVSAMVEKLVQEGMIKREGIDGDRRSTKITQSILGQGEFSKIMAKYQNWVNRYFEDLNDEEVKQLFHLLAKIQSAT